MINSILDTDLYKITMQQAVFQLYPDAWATYRFTNRNKKTHSFNEDFLNALREEIEGLATLPLYSGEQKFLRNTGYFTESYLDYLANYRFNPKEVTISLDEENQLQLDIAGPWHSTILWEVPLMAIISELYFKIVDKNWKFDEAEQRNKLKVKADILKNCQFADFGTRRRRSLLTQKIVVEELSKFDNFLGTSNVHLAQQYGVNPIGTFAHEWVMGHAALKGLRHANKFALEAWSQVYQGKLGIALTDTYGTEAFFRDFDDYLARLYDGMRQDSADPFGWGERAIMHYNWLKINPLMKKAVFSDNLDAEKAAKIEEHFRGRILPSFGIGTNLTNDFEGSKPLNMVIKLTSCNGIPVVKISDEPGKATGDRDAMRVAKWVHLGVPLDE